MTIGGGWGGVAVWARWRGGGGLGGGGACGLKIAIFNPVCPSWPPSRASSGLKTLLSEPAGIQNLTPGLIIAISNPVCPSWPPSDSLLGLKTLLSEPAALQNLTPGLKIAISNPVCLC